MDMWVLCYLFVDSSGAYAQAHGKAHTDATEAEKARSKMHNPYDYWVCKVSVEVKTSGEG